ncbi:hypothetical protein OHB33_05505 [Streptomyces sp. NBC_01558]|uniref:hypothetical protein n=1 Tax=Streptomyces sp. NBC_01558 TaxID=2975878 RepID=UPI002DD9051E|nr:hypothetical protein [Streptomyces sp. NBC_01558]WSD75800.1 hypothetical protein OHB33_05505 [Streptomyces sp. NBC_01558]
MAQTGRDALEGPELPQFVRLKFETICKCKNGAIGPFAFCQLRGNGIEDGSKDTEVRAGMLRQQAKKPVVVPGAVPVRCLREREGSIPRLDDSHHDPSAILTGKRNGEVGIHLHEEVPALALDRVKDVGMPTGCPPLADRVDSDGDVDVVRLKANRLISPPFEAALTLRLGLLPLRENARLPTHQAG